ncbi:hypothetical protein JCM10207_004239 [Rhodosporidiobolus poonsookiae]
MAFLSTPILSTRSTVTPPRPRRAPASRFASSSPVMGSKTDASSLSSSPRHSSRPASPGTRIPRPVSPSSGSSNASTPGPVTPVRPLQPTSLSLEEQLALEEFRATADHLYAQLEQLEAEGDDAALDELDELVALTVDLDSLIARISAGGDALGAEAKTGYPELPCSTSSVAVLPPSPDFATPPSSPSRTRTRCSSPSSSLDAIDESDESDFEADSLFDSFSSTSSSCGEDDEDTLFSPLSTPPSSPEHVVLCETYSPPACLPRLAIDSTKVLPSLPCREADDLFSPCPPVDLAPTRSVDLTPPTAAHLEPAASLAFVNPVPSSHPDHRINELRALFRLPPRPYRLAPPLRVLTPHQELVRQLMRPDSSSMAARLFLASPM